MGLFDIKFAYDCKSQKEALVLQEKMENHFKTTQKDKENPFIYQAPKSLLKYKLDFKVEKKSLIVQGELLQTLLIAILIILSILLTYGITLIIIVGYVYYQKINTTKVLKSIIKEVKGT